MREPEKVGDYTIGKNLNLIYLGKTLGKGTFGKVKIGTHIPTKEKVFWEDKC